MKNESIEFFMHKSRKIDSKHSSKFRKYLAITFGRCAVSISSPLSLIIVKF